MKKGIIATSVLALAIGCMTVFVSVQLCSWLPTLQPACWVQGQIQQQHVGLRVQYSEMNDWQKQIAKDYHRHVKEPVQAQYAANSLGQDCELGKEAAHALGHSKGASALSSLESIAIHASCLEVRKAAVYAIQGIGSEEAKEALVRILNATAR